MFAHNMAVQGTTQVAPYKLVYEWSPATMLDAMLLVVTDEEDLDDATQDISLVILSGSGRQYVDADYVRSSCGTTLALQGTPTLWCSGL